MEEAKEKKWGFQYIVKQKRKYREIEGIGEKEGGVWPLMRVSFWESKERTNGTVKRSKLVKDRFW